MDQLEMYRGDAREIEVTLTLASVAWPVPGGAMVRSTAKRHYQDSDANAVWTKDSDGDISVASNVVTVILAPADTESVATREVSQTLHVDVQVTSGLVGPWTVAEFELVVLPDVTRTQP